MSNHIHSFHPNLSYLILSYLIPFHPIIPYPITFHSIQSYHILCNPTPCHSILFHFILSYLVLSHAIPSHSIPSHPILSYPIPSHSIRSHHTLSYPILSHPIPFHSIPSHHTLSYSIQRRALRASKAFSAGLEIVSIKKLYFYNLIYISLMLYVFYKLHTHQSINIILMSFHCYSLPQLCSATCPVQLI